MNRVHIIHHLEPMWDKQYRNYRTSFDKLQQQHVDFLRRSRPDRIILTRFEAMDLDENYDPVFSKWIDEVRDYGYGWEEPGPDMIPGGSHSKYVWVPDWIKELAGLSVTVTGAFKGECLEDIDIALQHVGAKVRMWDWLIV